MAKISLDNGKTYLTAHDAAEKLQSLYTGAWTPFAFDGFCLFADNDVLRKIWDDDPDCMGEDLLSRYMAMADKDVILHYYD